MAGLDFHVGSWTTAPGWRTMDANTYAQEKHVVNYKNIGKYVGEGGESYAVIMTFGHQADELVLKQLAGKKTALPRHDGQPGQDRPDLRQPEKKGSRAPPA